MRVKKNLKDVIFSLQNILELVQIMLVLPTSAEQSERGFFAQNGIKN